MTKGVWCVPSGVYREGAYKEAAAHYLAATSWLPEACPEALACHSNRALVRIPKP